MTARIVISAITAVFGWAILSTLAEGAWDRTRGLRARKHPAAGPPVPPHRAAADEPPRLPHPLPGQPPEPGADPPLVPGNDYGRWLKSIDVFENATVVTDWTTGTSEVFPATYNGETQP